MSRPGQRPSTTVARILSHDYHIFITYLTQAPTARSNPDGLPHHGGALFPGSVSNCLRFTLKEQLLPLVGPSLNCLTRTQVLHQGSQWQRRVDGGGCTPPGGSPRGHHARSLLAATITLLYTSVITPSDSSSACRRCVACLKFLALSLQCRRLGTLRVASPQSALLLPCLDSPEPWVVHLCRTHSHRRTCPTDSGRAQHRRRYRRAPSLDALRNQLPAPNVGLWQSLPDQRRV